MTLVLLEEEHEKEDLSLLQILKIAPFKDL